MIDVTKETDAIQAQFLANREAAVKGLLANPEPYISGQADALGITFVQAAKLVAHGMASMLRDLAVKNLQVRLEQEATKKEVESRPANAMADK